MKTLKKLITLTVLTVALSTVTAQSPPKPNGNSDPTDDNTPVGSNGNGAPIGGGIAMLLAMGVAYGGKKVYDYKKHKMTE